RGPLRSGRGQATLHDGRPQRARDAERRGVRGLPLAMPCQVSTTPLLSPPGRGGEAMTCGCAAPPDRANDTDGAGVSHLAELVRGDSSAKIKAPSSALRAPSPKGEKGRSWPSEQNPCWT